MNTNNQQIDPAVLAARRHFAQICKDCVQEVLTGKDSLPSHVTLGQYAYWQWQDVQSVMRGDWDDTFTFRQRMHWIKTGNCIPLLP